MGRQTLFRQEAVEFRGRRNRWGSTAAVEPPSARLLFAGILVTVAAAVAFLSTAQYARKETVPGYLAPTAGIVRVYAPRQGTIRAVHVEEEQRVEAGQPLLTVSVDQTAADGADVDARVLDALARQKVLLAERIATQDALSAAERLRLHARIEGISAEIAQLEQQIATQGERVRLAATRSASAADLRSQGVVSDAEYKQRREAQLEQQRGLNALALELVTRRNERTAAVLELDRVPASTAERIQALREELLQVEQRAAEIEGRRGYLLLAPASGRVSTLQATVGRTADPRHPQLSILPENGLLHAELFIPTRAAGFVRLGQEVRILYAAFPFQRFGAYRGRVARISRTVLMGGDVTVPVPIQEASYKVIVSLERQAVDSDDGPTPLQPDMLLSADLVLERRPILAWLLDPLLKMRLS